MVLKHDLRVKSSSCCPCEETGFLNLMLNMVLEYLSLVLLQSFKLLWYLRRHYVNQQCRSLLYEHKWCTYLVD